ncbi:MAG: FAD:protein FMN transferase, partial [Planctomycetales bacterium]|nr:FAD:protein FMN transferase [Planctomycetales bacterium]
MSRVSLGHRVPRTSVANGSHFSRRSLESTQLGRRDSSFPRPRLAAVGLTALLTLVSVFAPGAAAQESSSQVADSASPQPSSSEGVWTFTGPTMGTTYQVLVVGSSQAEAGVNDQATVARRITDELESVNQAMSTYRDDSEVSRFNQSAGSDWFPVSLATATVVQKAQEIARASEGAFDITVGPLVNRWSFGPDREITSAPSEAEIETLKQRIGYSHLEVRLDPPALKKTLPELSIDLSAIAKGYGVDRVALALEELGFGAYLVEVGGEVRSRGSRPD